jgi:Zn-dependent protease with chaperone function
MSLAPLRDTAELALLSLAWAVLPPGLELVPLASALPSALVEASLEAVFALPHSRACEHEADAVGLRVAAAACYDPARAAAFWRGMERLQAQAEALGAAGEPPAMLSTHPAHGARAARIGAALPQALAIRAGSALCPPLPPPPPAAAEAAAAGGGGLGRAVWRGLWVLLRPSRGE